ncbi:hypothetical protein GCM10010289_37110 [Streptomyces violascens]|nr:hypothetical protein GCM10010289_37110 [Streptomyces violascens]
MTRAAADSAAVAARRVNPGRPKGLFEYKELPSMGGRFAGSGRAEVRGWSSMSGRADPARAAEHGRTFGGIRAG